MGLCADSPGKGRLVVRTESLILTQVLAEDFKLGLTAGTCRPPPPGPSLLSRCTHVVPHPRLSRSYDRLGAFSVARSNLNTSFEMCDISKLQR